MTSSQPSTISVGRSTDVGQIREINEDFILVDEELGLYVVCDGMGGHAAGEVASKTAAETVREVVAAGPMPGEMDTPALDELMRRAVTEANRRVHALGQQAGSRKGMGTTCTALLVRGLRAALAHVGDSRLYVRRGESVHLMSQDHTFIAEAIRQGVIKPEEIRPDMPHANIVTRAVGPKPSVLVDTLVFDLIPGDTLLLCSDGLHQYFMDSGELSTCLGAEEVTEIAPQMVATANERGGEDNISALVLRVLDAPQVAKRAGEITQTFSALTHIHLFHELSMTELAKVQEHLQKLQMPAGATVFEQGDKSEGLYIVSTGKVRVHRGDVEIAVLGEGAHFGEMALLNQRPRAATVTVLSDARLLYLSRQAFYAVVQADTVVGVKFLWKLAQTLSLRLDEAYETPEQFLQKRETLTFGLFPSPFSRKKK
ncbi:MAG: cyclic nucleotide-binding domain-containing protein [Deltaproteobacteria bacterium]|nr:cyclic nucleotide-binding domain-containing protein [Deltaproteobacteria bacterium]